MYVVTIIIGSDLYGVSRFRVFLFKVFVLCIIVGLFPFILFSPNYRLKRQRSSFYLESKDQWIGDCGLLDGLLNWSMEFQEAMNVVTTISSDFYRVSCFRVYLFRVFVLRITLGLFRLYSVLLQITGQNTKGPVSKWNRRAGESEIVDWLDGSSNWVLPERRIYWVFWIIYWFQ